MATGPSPQIHIIAGPNGAGKTTFARRFLPHRADCLHFVNADLIAAGLSPFAPELAAVRAGRLMLEQIRQLADQGRDFAFETTLAGRSYEPMLRDFRSRGYALHLYFLWLPRVELALTRIADRVRQGGHHVPEADVRRRYGRGVYNFLHVYRPLLDSWVVFDNSGLLPREVASEKAGVSAIMDANSFRVFSEAAAKP